jgi:hypothetical protein
MKMAPKQYIKDLHEMAKEQLTKDLHKMAPKQLTKGLHKMALKQLREDLYKMVPKQHTTNLLKMAPKMTHNPGSYKEILTTNNRQLIQLKEDTILIKLRNKTKINQTITLSLLHSFSYSMAKLWTTSGEQEEKAPNQRRKIKWILECERQNMDPNYEDQNDDVSAKTCILIMRLLFQQNDGE